MFFIENMPQLITEKHWKIVPNLRQETLDWICSTNLICKTEGQESLNLQPTQNKNHLPAATYWILYSSSLRDKTTTQLRPV